MNLLPIITYNDKIYTIYNGSDGRPVATVTRDSTSTTGENKMVYGYCSPNCRTFNDIINVLEDGTIVTLRNGEIVGYGSNILGNAPRMPQPPSFMRSMHQPPDMSGLKNKFADVKNNFSEGASRFSGSVSSFFNRGKTGGRKSKKSRKFKKSRKSKKSRRYKK